MKNVVIVDGMRTPFGRLGGGLRQFHNVEMGAITIRALLEKTQLDIREVDAVYYGTANGDALCNNPARYTALKAGLPYESTAVAVEMQCGSGIAAMNHAAYRIAMNDADVVLVGGGETFSQRYAKFSTSTEPYKMIAPAAITPQLAPAKEDQLIMIQVADRMAEKWASPGRNVTPLRCGARCGRKLPWRTVSWTARSHRWSFLQRRKHPKSWWIRTSIPVPRPRQKAWPS